MKKRLIILSIGLLLSSNLFFGMTKKGEFITAIISGNFDKTKKLLTKVNPDIKDNNNNSLIHFFAVEGINRYNLKTFKLIVDELIAKNKNLNAKNKLGQTPMQFFVRNVINIPYTSMAILYLLEKGATIEEDILEQIFNDKLIATILAAKMLLPKKIPKGVDKTLKSYIKKGLFGEYIRYLKDISKDNIGMFAGRWKNTIKEILDNYKHIGEIKAGKKTWLTPEQEEKLQEDMQKRINLFIKTFMDK